MAFLKIIRGTKADIDQVPVSQVSDGALLFATDTHQIFLDQGDSRIEMSSVIDVSNYVTNEQLNEAVESESSERELKDQELQAGIDSKLSSTDIVEGDNITLNYDDETKKLTISSTGATVADNSITLTKLASDVGTVAVQSSTPTDSNVKLWIQI